MKKKFILALVSIGLFTSMTFAAPRGGALGGGIVIGDPFGPTAKIWISRTQALDFTLGFADDFTLNGGYLWHSWDLFPKPSAGALAGYAGIGPRIEWHKRDRRSDEVRSGIRVPFGVDYFMANQPIEVFFELVPVFQVAPDTDTDLDAGIGIRFYFTGAK